MTTQNLYKQADLPVLQIVPTDSLVPHEAHDMQRSDPLVRRLREEGALKNPPIVAPIEGDERYVVLDGTNRAMALTALDCPHVIVQVVDYELPELILDTWYHLVCEMPSGDFFVGLHAIDGLHVEPVELLHARAELARRQATAYVVTPPSVDDLGSMGHAPGSAYVLYAEGDLNRRTMILNEVVKVYQARGRINRTRSDHLERLLPYYDNVTSLVVFPRYEPSEIVELARQGAYLPSGITRHVIPGRALRVNFPLRLLADDKPIEEKNAWLQNWMRQKLANKEVRYYQESTYLFDE